MFFLMRNGSLNGDFHQDEHLVSSNKKLTSSFRMCVWESFNPIC